jgi:tRNA pseudouridine38-40 synthase
MPCNNRTEDHKTIEGDLFSAFVAAGAISKANATDPKKSSLVRCARTDKGVHAAGNIVSLKLIVEDPDVVKKINDNLASQIRVWGLVPTTKGFSSYHGCDSRIYEYLIPTHCFIPPHPSTFLAQKIREACLETGDLEEYNKRQADALTYWEETDNTYIKPILDELPPKARKEVQDALLIPDDTSKKDTASASEDNTPAPESTKAESEPTTTEPAHTEDQNEEALSENHEVIEAVRKVRAAYFKAKKTYRIHQDRVARVNEALSLYVGTKNYHNFTIQKAFSDPSSKRVIRSFQVSGEPKLINGTEWLSLKVHGQSFMMHQIRKMVAMVALVVRCGSPTDLITRAYGPEKIPIPKAPGLGLLLERPIFDNYNNRAVNQFNRQPIDFAVYDKEIEEFKQREIYERIFREEEASDTYVNSFSLLFYSFAGRRIILTDYVNTDSAISSTI